MSVNLESIFPLLEPLVVIIEALSLSDLMSDLRSGCLCVCAGGGGVGGGGGGGGLQNISQGT